MGQSSSGATQRHAAQQAVVVDELMLEGAGHMGQHQSGQAVGQPGVDAFQQLAEVVVLGHEIGQRQLAEPDDREALGRAHRPAGQRHRKEGQVEQQMHRMGGTRLPGRHRRIGRRAVRQPPQQPQGRQRQDGHAGPFVPVVELEPLRRERQVGHVQADQKGADDGERQQPVQHDSDAGIAEGGAHDVESVWPAASKAVHGSCCHCSAILNARGASDREPGRARTPSNDRIATQLSRLNP
mmetsp:Transcript_36522/g.66277  ORF Transcript_36522/g.66277 Transcript_36522/m.66277 type:complete len:239 (+) Transcript_36522:317-1033(+)